MTKTKHLISKELQKETGLSKQDSLKLINKFLSIIKDNSKTKKIKINGFGVFNYAKTKERIGRNPKTRESYIIKPMKRLRFTTSKRIKEILN